jgi:putative Ca2+/H+ antiporter (TMEM165/GDT1 family)
VNPFLVSAAVVAVAEIGDKTQLLALVLAAKFRKPTPIILGILIATLANHVAAAAVGTWVSGVTGPDVMRWTPPPSRRKVQMSLP